MNNQNHINTNLVRRWVLAITLFLSIFSFTIVANATSDTQDAQRTEVLSNSRQKLKRSIFYRSCIRKYYLTAYFFTGKYNNAASFHNLISKIKWRFSNRPPSFIQFYFYSILLHLPAYPKEDFQPTGIYA